jgi:hypothetical protein
LRRARLQADDILQNIRSVCSPSMARAGWPSEPMVSACSADAARMTGHTILDTLKHRSPEMWAAMVSAIRHGRKVSRSGDGAA